MGYAGWLNTSLYPGYKGPLALALALTMGSEADSEGGVMVKGSTYTHSQTPLLLPVPEGKLGKLVRRASWGCE